MLARKRRCQFTDFGAGIGQAPQSDLLAFPD
jgi:hypothetical protein